VSTHDEAKAYISQLNSKVRPLAQQTHKILLAQGCTSYVKTIYVGYDIDGVMVAAMYGHADHLELALALPEDAEGDILVDASHLTWRTLPVAALIKAKQDLPLCEVLVADACNRIRLDSHDVNRDNEFFTKSRRERDRP